MYIIAGLGNPGLSYRKTRHNAGFNTIDHLADEFHIRVTKRGHSGLYGEGVYNGERVVLLKPQTYMNLSGDCIQKILHYYKVSPENLIVIYDDISLPAGSIRIRANGSAGTHNGMRSILACIHTENFPRVRIGVGDERGEADLKDYVLGKPSKEESVLLEKAYANATEAVKMILCGYLDRAQAEFNKKHEGIN